MPEPCARLGTSNKLRAKRNIIHAQLFRRSGLNITEKSLSTRVFLAAVRTYYGKYMLSMWTPDI